MIHKFKAKGLNILLDVNSGGVHLIDDVTYDLLDYAQPPFEEECPTKYIDALKTDYSEEEIKESYADIVALYHDKLLFSEDIYGDFANTAVESPIKAMCLHIAHDCNLRCKYCFASTGDFGTGRKLMPLEVGIAASTLFRSSTQICAIQCLDMLHNKYPPLTYSKVHLSK